jgi:lon-related putative ATP-dependent protease
MSEQRSMNTAEMTTKPAAALPADRLYRPVDPTGLKFESTAELAPVEGLVGQDRALGAIRFGTGIAKSGFNLFVIGQPDARMRDTVRSLLEVAAKEQRRPSDWVYVNNFKEPHRPVAIELPPGRAPEFRAAMAELVDDLKAALPAVFNSEEYQTRRGAIDEAFQRRQGEAFAELQARANSKNVAILRTPLGFALAPTRNGEVIPPAEFNSWPEEKRREVQTTIEELERELEQVMRRIPQWEKERRDELRALNQETARVAVDQSIDEVKGKFSGLARVSEHLDQVRADLVENVAFFVAKGEEGESPSDEGPAGGPFDRYQVNVLVTQADHGEGAPVIEEQHATLQNLIGRVEHVARQGVLVTNFRLIKPGALHRANGGYLLLDVRSLLTEVLAWPALKRALRRRQIVIEDIARLIGLSTTVSLEPDPIPLDLKVVLFGDRLLYFLLAAFDPELNEHFKVLADFEDDIDRSPDSERVLAQLIAGIGAREKLRPMDRNAVALVIEHAARIAGHAGKLSLSIEQLRDLLAEADFWAGQAGRSTATAADVQQAIDRKIERASRLRDRMQETILQNVALIDTSGTRVGQVNGLSVIELGGFAFGRPSRITCQVRPGSGKVVDIEREVELGGPIHSKGVLILSGFLAGRFALDTPMSLYGSLVFEQSYSGVEGDSASSAELYAMLSALADVPLRQDLAVTGSVNQHGEVQAIGGVNEKIEGFYDICHKRGLTGTQGVLIPESNVQHLMLRRDVVEACAAGRFAVYPIATVDQGIALLTGREAGARGVDGRYPKDSIFGRVEERLRTFAAVRRSFAASTAPEAGKN